MELFFIKVLIFSSQKCVKLFLLPIVYDMIFYFKGRNKKLEVLLRRMFGRSSFNNKGGKGDLKRNSHVKLFQYLCPPFFSAFYFLWHFWQLPSFIDLKAFWPLWQAPQYLPSFISAMVMFVPFFIGKTFGWQSVHFNPLSPWIVPSKITSPADPPV